jgi:hypothetical protein
MDMDLLLGVIGATTLGVTLFGSALLGWRMWLRSKTERMNLAGRDDIERLIEAVDALHERVHFMQEEMGELNERVDFAERLLSKGEEPGEPHKPDPLVAT